MKCPKCKQEALSFTKWCMGKNAIVTECSSCGVGLKANSVVYIGILLTIAVTAATFPFIDELWGYIDVTSQYRWLKGMILAPGIIVVGSITWFTGAYKLKNNT